MLVPRLRPIHFAGRRGPHLSLFTNLNLKTMNFKTSLTLLAAMGLMAFNATSGNVDAEAARAAAAKFLVKNKTATFKSSSASNLKLTYTEASSVEGNAFYVFNINGGGWIIMAGDDHARQVLAYGDKGNIDMNELPANMKGQLNMYKRQIEAMQSYKGKLVPMKAPKRVTPVAPLTKSTWGQSEPMNRLCPMAGTNRTSVGCGPLAMAQIVYYWKYPTEIPELPGYSISWSQSVPTLPATTIDYSLLLDKYTIFNPETNGVALGTYTEDQANEVAKLSRYCGQACKARYGNSGTSTGSYTYDQLAAFKTFGYNEGAQLIGYDPSYYCSNSNKFTEEEWKALISVELEAGRPIAYHNVDFIDGHAWVLDGVDADGKFHMNWGFYERFDGWFEFGAFGFYPYGDSEYWDFSCSGSTSNEMIINLYPYEGYVIPGDDDVLIGDVDNDGEVSIGDVSALTDYLLTGDASGINLDAADIDSDNNVSIGDVSALIDKLLN